MLAELERHPHARAVLGPALAPGGKASHAYLFHGPGGAGKRSVARAMAAELLAQDSPDPTSARMRAMSGAHPDLTWVAPSGAHEILVGDIDGPVVAAASKTPFEAGCRVFVIEHVDELGDEAANRMLKTLEEPASFVHLILLTTRLVEVLPTIRSRCQVVRFDAPPIEEVARQVELAGADRETAMACARLSLGDAEQARELAGEEGRVLRAAAEGSLAPRWPARSPAPRRGRTCLRPCARVGTPRVSRSSAEAAEELELYPRKEHKRIETEWTERIRRARRRVETGALDLALQVVSLWYADLACLAWGAEDLVRNSDRLAELKEAGDVDPARLRGAIELVEDTRLRFVLNVSEELACEALAYRLERLLAL